jgi:phenylacetate-CoA ligase
MVRWAYRTVPLYHRTFRENGISPSDFHGRDDLHRLPRLSKGEILSAGDQILSRASSGKKLLVERTSGSSGRMTNVYLTEAEKRWKNSIRTRSLMETGHGIWDRMLLLGSVDYSGLEGGVRRARLPPTVVSDPRSPVAEQVKLIDQYKPRTLVSLPSNLVRLAEEGFPGNGFRFPRRLVTLGEATIDEERKLIASNLGREPYDQYGAVELGRIAWQCDERDGYHINADSVAVEIVEDGEEAAPGEDGRIVCTSLFSFAMPIIRYDLEDISSFREECGCGRPLPVLGRVRGRRDDFLSLPRGGSIYPGQVRRIMFLRPSISAYRVIQGRRNRIRALIMPKDGLSQVEQEELAADVKGALEDLARDPDLEIIVQITGHIPASGSGKRKAIVSSVG